MPEYRPVPDDRADDFRAITNYAFSPADGPYDPEAADDRPTISRRRGLFDGDEPLAVCAHYGFDLRVRGADRRVAGLSAVACPPEHRRQGRVRRLLRESLGEYRADGLHYSALWPFEYGFYRQYGWATASRYRHLEAPPDQLAFASERLADPDAGRFRRLDEGDAAAAEPVLAAMAERYPLTMRRSEEWWRHRTLGSWGDDPFLYGWERDGELRGFLRYRVREEDDDRVLSVNDVAFADRTAWLHLLRFCRNHDSQVETVRLRAPPDVDVLDGVDDPRATTHELRTGPMVRLVDVAAALEELPGPSVGTLDRSAPGSASGSAADGSPRLVLDVSDPLADWNDRRFALAASPEGITVERDPETADAGTPTAEVDVGTLSQLVVGYRSVGDARRAGSLSTSDAGAELLSALFPPRTTHLREHF